jgi:hypothetical protein
MPFFLAQSPTRAGADKKPKDMIRAIGKLESDDWNVKNIQDKIDDQKKPPVLCSGEEDRRVPKWSKDIFREKVNKHRSARHDHSRHTHI